MATGDPVAFPNHPGPCVGVCNVHSLMEQVMAENRADVAEMRRMMTEFIQHAAEEHSRIREEILLVAKTAHEVKGRSDVAPGEPHPLQRAEDYQERVVLTLSRKDFWKLVMFSVVILFLITGFALIAGKDGLDIWGKLFSTAPKVIGP